ncbi:MAG: phosphoribosylamine--glycine ligase [Gammaproteobacteria bacterium]|nr:phosphoribosylamine--glycine ligase [Gammaproteobacteria bacterium]
MKKVLVIGSGGREHALAWKASLSSDVSAVFVAPGNAGTALEKKTTNVPLQPSDFEGLLNFALDEQIDLVIVGPEDVLVNGIVDQFREAGVPCFGPTKKAARLEGSKEFSKDFMTRHKIPTAQFQSFSDLEKAIDYLKHQDYPLVIKADGLAAGKGVVICRDMRQAGQCIEEMLSGEVFDGAGEKIVIEEFLQGEEASFICMVNEQDFLVMASSQDHKAAYNGDAGPNTGGMGAYSPAPVIDPQMHEAVIEQVIKPTINGLVEDGISYTGFLYAGLMIQDGIPNVLEFNCRMGDPESQVIMMRLKSDLVTLCMAALTGRLGETEAEWFPQDALGVVMASQGYPGDYAKGRRIDGLETVFDNNTKVFHAGTRLVHGEVTASGGRVLCITALGKNIVEAQKEAYKAASSISWQGGWHRDDIGHRAVYRFQASE